MPSWVSAAIFAILVVLFPYMVILRILLQLPKPIALSHRRWTIAVNIAVIFAITALIAVYIHSAYYRRVDPYLVLMQFVIAALAYAFGLVLILRQFGGLYPGFFIPPGRSGRARRKTACRNVINIEEVARVYGESRLRIETSYGTVVQLTLPARDVPSLYERVKPPL